MCTRNINDDYCYVALENVENDKSAPDFDVRMIFLLIIDAMQLIKRVNLLISKRYPEKLPEQRVCDSIIFEIPILTVASMVSYVYDFNNQNRDLKYNGITNSIFILFR